MVIEAARWFLERAAEYTFSAFASWTNFAAAIGAISGTFTDLTSGLAWPYLLASLIISGAVFIFSRRTEALPISSFREFLFPRHVYRHPSADLDYRFYIVSTFLKVLLWVPILTGIGLLGQKTMKTVLIGYASWEPPTTLPFAYLFGAVLQHSPLPISYGPLVNRLIVSPIQHQVHHSIDPRHRNKNFGLKFALWDALFGTLYVPRGTEQLKVGLPDADPQEFSTVGKLYFLPFAKAARELSSLPDRRG